MKKKGFTLIELLAVIVILAIILAIAIPSILNIVNNAKIDAFESNAKLVFKALDYQKLVDDGFNPTLITESNIKASLKLGDEDYESVIIMYKGTDEVAGQDDKNQLYIIIKGKNKWAGLVAYGTRNNITVTTIDEFEKTVPVINIIGSNPMNVNLGGTYAEPGATATDTIDGSLTSDIKITGVIDVNTIGTYHITYRVTNSLGNMTTMIRTVNVVDNVLPVITILGTNPVDINLGSEYVDAGATATDNIDGDITSSIQVVSTVNTALVGTYIVSYGVSDSSGNHATAVTRTVNVINSSDYIVNEGVNKPRLVMGMTAIKWNTGTSTWDDVETSDTDTSWYDYASGEWANAKTADGSMWVWIPRYIYKITRGWHSNGIGAIEIQFTKDTNDNWNSAVVGNIDTGTGASASNNKWTNEPAFTFGSTELTGFWIAKFEATAREGLFGDAVHDNVTTKHVKILPEVNSWVYMNIGNVFTVCRNMETDNTYGWGTSGSGIDSHLTKNVEWGAVAYLSTSIYGKNGTEVWINPDNTTKKTGRAGQSASAKNPSTTYPYNNTTYGIKASTTGTIYGVYDMSGGMDEFISAYLNNAYSNLALYGSNIINADIKYKDVYTNGDNTQTGNFNQAISKKGDAIYETSAGGIYGGTGSLSWFSDYSNFPSQNNPWFLRGAFYFNATDAGVYSFNTELGAGGPVYGFRPSLIVGTGL